jgi:hypothetical protein
MNKEATNGRGQEVVYEYCGSIKVNIILTAHHVGMKILAVIIRWLCKT